MRVRPFIMLIAAGTATAVLSTACGSDPSGVSSPGPPMFTTIDGVVRFMDTLPVISGPVWVDSIPVPGVVVRVMETTFTYLQDPAGLTTHVIEVASVRTDSNGAYSLSFTASCDGPGPMHAQTWFYWFDVDNYQVNTFDPSGVGGGRMVHEVCDIPAIQWDLWVLPER